MTHTVIPEDELKVFASLPNVKVVFDVGAREDVDYLILKPGIKLHCFEPDPVTFQELKANVGNIPNVYLNNFGLGDVAGHYEFGGQVTGKRLEKPTDSSIEIKLLDDYVRQRRIKRIDFLKIDVEGFDERVLIGGKETIKKCRYIQYEQAINSSKYGFNKFLPEDQFDMYYIGYRNVLGVRKGEPLPWMPEETKEGGTGEKDASHYLK